VKNNSQTNDFLMGVPYRFDLTDTSCVNKKVDSFNNKLTKIVKPFKHAALLKFEKKREHFTRHGMHLNGTGKESSANLIVVFIQKREKPICLGWKVKPNDCISEVNEVKQDCFPLIASISNDINNNEFLNNLNNRMCSPVMENLVCPENHSSSKGPATNAAVNKAGRL
jgi:hypothetical protein